MVPDYKTHFLSLLLPLKLVLDDPVIFCLFSQRQQTIKTINSPHLEKKNFRNRPPPIQIFKINMSQYSMSPVGALQERCQSRGVAPEYRTIQVQVQVQVEDMVAMGSGSSEKEAEDAAARAMLDKLDRRAPQQDGSGGSKKQKGGVQPLPPRHGDGRRRRDDVVRRPPGRDSPENLPNGSI